MKNLWLICLGILLLSCAHQHREIEAVAINSSRTIAPLASGVEIARELTARYLNVATNCGTVTAPAFLCSGIIYRGTSYSTSYDTWNPSPESQRSGGVTFSYLRKDANASRIIGGSNKGFIFYPVFTMPPDKVKASILCTYVREAGTNERKESGCGGHSNLPVSEPCETQGVSTAALWVAHYQANGSSLDGQCGFGVRSDLNAVAVAGFNAMLGVHALGIVESTKNIELRLATWPQDTPKTVPIQAFFYVDGGLEGVQYDQRQFFYKSGIYVPVIFITLPATATGNATFEYKESDQAWGEGVARDLQRHYYDTRPHCGDDTKPAFQCSGILLRATRATEDYHFWDPVPGHTGAGFSYLRSDSKFKRFYSHSAGFIFFPSLEAPAGKFSVSVLCSFPIDGNTVIRGQPGCAHSYAFPVESKPCNTQGITTAEQWYAHYLTAPANQDSSYICGFDVSVSMGSAAASAFYQSILAMGLLGARFSDQYNELVVASWPQNIPLEVPVQAVFYSTAASLESARFFQQDFMTATHLFIPVIKITMPQLPDDEAVFEYSVSDQAVSPLSLR
ncbi:hypothetical protein NLO98_07710 [Pseudomonas syringae]|nr:hypothetical protein [Pseudomonas syringae]